MVRCRQLHVLLHCHHLPRSERRLVPDGRIYRRAGGMRRGLIRRRIHSNTIIGRSCHGYCAAQQTTGTPSTGPRAATRPHYSLLRGGQVLPARLHTRTVPQRRLCLDDAVNSDSSHR